MPDYAVAPQEYSDTYIDYGNYNEVTLTLMVRSNQLRALFTPGSTQKVVGVFDFDLAGHYAGGQVGIFMAANQAVISDFSLTPLTGPGAAKKFCDGQGKCLPNGLCETMAIDGPPAALLPKTQPKSSSSSSSSGTDGTFVGVVIGLLAFCLLVFAASYYYGKHYSQVPYHHAILGHDMEMTKPDPSDDTADVNPLRGSAY